MGHDMDFGPDPRMENPNDDSLLLDKPMGCLLLLAALGVFVIIVIAIGKAHL